MNVGQITSGRSRPSSIRSGCRGSRLSSKFCAKRPIPNGKPLFPSRRSREKIKFHCWPAPRWIWNGSRRRVVAAAVARRLSERRAEDVDPRRRQTGALEYHRSIQILALPESASGLKEIAVDLGMDADAFQAVAALVPVPFLQACNRRMAAIDKCKLDGRILSGVRRLAGFCRGARDRAQPLLALRPLRWRMAGAVFVLPILRHDGP